MPVQVNQKVIIARQVFELLDAKEKMTVPDCWVKKNKIGTAHGEAKFYVGQRNDTAYKFFERIGENCFFLKSDIIKYLEEVKEEYGNPQQPYRFSSKMPEDWKEYYEQAKGIPGEIITFSMQPQAQINGPRFYFNSSDEIYQFVREISLPNITYLASLKLKDSNGKIFYYFKLFVDYFGEDLEDKEVEEEIKESGISDTEKETLVRARKGQGKYREGVLKECPYCPITIVSDDRLLIASHIKPWVKSETREKTDPKNGFMFTPTYDFLFDRGFITFTDEQKMVVSPWLSKMTCSKLNLVDNKKYPLLPVEGRKHYLEYHRDNIFKR